MDMRFIRLQIMCIICVWFLTLCHSEIYTSIAEMEDLLGDVRRTIKQDISVLKTLPRKERIRVKKNAQKLAGFSDIILHPDFTVRHPINAYTFLQNLSYAYDEKVQAILLVNGTATNQRIFSKLASTDDDINSIRMAIFRIQETYDLQAADILEGNINGHLSSEVINDCFDFIVPARAYHTNSTLSGDWLAACANTVGTDSTSMISIKAAKEVAEDFERKEMFKDAAGIYERLVEIEPGQHAKKLRYLRRMMPRKGRIQVVDQKHPLVEIQDNLCRGVDLKTPAERQSKHLVCKLLHDHPLLKLQPGRAELRSRDPHIVIYHNFLSKTEMNRIKKAAKRTMVRATVNYGKGAEQINSPLRTCKNAFVDMTRPPFTVTRKMESLTGLKTGPFLNNDSQIANYGVGGHYFIHSDFYGPESIKLDERMATFMFYLSDVESGGATVFLPAKETIYPEEGAAVFWYNTYRNGTVNRNTQHAACPVAVGNKWIGTFWVRMNRQEFTKPCSIKKNYQYWPF